MHPALSRRRGFTLPELIIALGLGAVALGLLASSLLGTTSALSYGTVDGVSSVKADRLLERIREDLKHAAPETILLATDANGSQILSFRYAHPSIEGERGVWQGSASWVHDGPWLPGSRVQYLLSEAESGAEKFDLSRRVLSAAGVAYSWSLSVLSKSLAGDGFRVEATDDVYSIELRYSYTLGDGHEVQSEHSTSIFLAPVEL